MPCSHIKPFLLVILFSEIFLRMKAQNLSACEVLFISAICWVENLFLLDRFIWTTDVKLSSLKEFLYASSHRMVEKLAQTLSEEKIVSKMQQIKLVGFHSRSATPSNNNRAVSGKIFATKMCPHHTFRCGFLPSMPGNHIHDWSSRTFAESVIHQRADRCQTLLARGTGLKWNKTTVDDQATRGLYQEQQHPQKRVIR